MGPSSHEDGGEDGSHDMHVDQRPLIAKVGQKALVGQARCHALALESRGQTGRDQTGRRLSESPSPKA